MPSVAHGEATLRVIGPDVDPDDVARMLGCAADHGHTRGDTVGPGLVGERVARAGLWSIRAASRAPADLDASVAELLARTTADLTAWAAVGARHRLDLFCALMLDEWNEGIALSAASMRALGERGIVLELDVYGSEPARRPEGV